MLISGSKALAMLVSIAVVAISDKYTIAPIQPNTTFWLRKFGYTFVLRIIYALSSGATHSSQYALAAMLKAANDGKFNFVEEVKEYGNRAAKMKKMFLEAGFKIVYDKDLDEDIADGFYFTISYPGLSGGELVKELLYYGISAISLDNTGSKRSEGLRACVSQIREDKMSDLFERLQIFKQNHQ
jgi:hypothetical protein